MKEVLEKIRPGKEERQRVEKVSQEFLQKLGRKLKHAMAILGGSGAKGTWLSDNHDVDIFVAFDRQKVDVTKLSLLLAGNLRKAFPKEKITTLHGSRDYFQMNYHGLNFEVVPILNIKKAVEAQNITDVSPLHSKWLNAKAKKVKDDILLVKQFCKAQGCYGAESHIGGFSGYVLEILVVRYGSFTKLLQAAQKWKEKDVIDVEKQYKSAADTLFHMNTSKLHAPLVVVDPVDKNRNAAAALSPEKFLSFKERARKYLQHPAAGFFEKKSLDVAALKKEGAVVLEITPLEGKQDVVGVKILKVFGHLQQKLAPFGVTDAGWEWNEKAILYFKLRKKELPAVMIHSGPPLALTDHVADFKRKNKETFIENGRIMAPVKVLHPKLADFVEALLQDTYIQERIKGIRLL